MWYTNKETKQYRKICKKMFTIEITWWVGRVVFVLCVCDVTVCVDGTFREYNTAGMSEDDNGGWTCVPCVEYHRGAKLVLCCVSVSEWIVKWCWCGNYDIIKCITARAQVNEAAHRRRHALIVSIRIRCMRDVFHERNAIITLHVRFHDSIIHVPHPIRKYIDKMILLLHEMSTFKSNSS